jgi:asparagine synthase (glutamine-hydrolysing)
MSFYQSGDRYVQSMSFLRFTSEAKEALFTDQAKNQIVDRESKEKVLEYFNADNVADLVDRMLYSDLMTRIPDHLLMIADRMTMAHSLESRAPFLDYKLVEYAAAIPAEYKLKGRDLKHILKRVAARYLPKELIYREKQGFGFPIARWMRKDLNRFLRNLFAESRFIALGLFNQAYIDQLLTQHLSGKADHNFRLWILVNLELWYRIYYEDQNPGQMLELTDRLMAA